MSDQPQKSRWSPFSMMLGVVVLIVLYVLSIGPVAWLVDSSGITIPGWLMSSLESFYAPIIWIIENNTFLTKPFIWYEELFA